jgi:N-acetylneuraminic acid mutarotase
LAPFHIRARYAIALIASSAVACDDPPGPPSDTRLQSPAVLTAQAGDSQFGAPGSPVPIRPAVKVVDEAGQPVQGVAVTFAVTSGGGSATNTNALSDSTGVATVGSWILGAEVGTNTMTATVPGDGDVDPFVFTAISLCDCWTMKAPTQVPRYDAGSAVIDGKLYVATGHNTLDLQLPLQVYDPTTDTWTSRGMLPSNGTMGVAALGGRLYVVAWEGAWGQSPRGVVESYDPTTGEWARHASPIIQRQQFAAAALNGILYVVGGHEGEDYSRALEAYDPATDTWTVKTPMQHPRKWMTVAVANGKLYAIGGDGNINGHVRSLHSSVEAYDPVTDSWTPKAPLPTKLIFAAADVVDGIIYVVGGGPLYSTATPNVYAYDPESDTWSIAPPMRTARYLATAATIDGVLYVVGGYGNEGPLGTVEAFRRP